MVPTESRGANDEAMDHVGTDKRPEADQLRRKSRLGARDGGSGVSEQLCAAELYQVGG